MLACFITRVQARASVHYPHTHTHWVQVQKYTARRLFSFYVQMSRLERNEKAPQGQRACISTVCHFLLEQKEQGGQRYKKKKKRSEKETRAWRLVVKQSAVTWRQRWASPGHGCPPCQSNGRWRREGSGWSAYSAGGGRKRQEVFR